MPRAEFRCAGSRTRLEGYLVRLTKRRFVFFASTDIGRLLLGSRFVGTLTRKNGVETITVDGSRTRLVGQLLTFPWK